MSSEYKRHNSQDDPELKKMKDQYNELMLRLQDVAMSAKDRIDIMLQIYNVLESMMGYKCGSLDCCVANFPLISLSSARTPQTQCNASRRITGTTKY